MQIKCYIPAVRAVQAERSHLCCRAGMTRTAPGPLNDPPWTQLPVLLGLGSLGPEMFHSLPPQTCGSIRGTANGARHSSRTTSSKKKRDSLSPDPSAFRTCSQDDKLFPTQLHHRVNSLNLCLRNSRKTSDPTRKEFPGQAVAGDGAWLVTSGEATLRPNGLSNTASQWAGADRTVQGRRGWGLCCLHRPHSPCRGSAPFAPHPETTDKMHFPNSLLASLARLSFADGPLLAHQSCLSTVSLLPILPTVLHQWLQHSTHPPGIWGSLLIARTGQCPGSARPRETRHSRKRKE